MKYQFVKKRQEISTEQIHSLRDFDSVLAGSKQVSGLAYSGKLLWGLAVIPAIGIVYLLTVGRPSVNDKQPALADVPVKEEAVSARPPVEAAPATRLDDQKPTPSTSEQPVAKQKTSPPAEKKSAPPSETGAQQTNQVQKEDVYLNAEPKEGFELFYAFIETELTYPELARKDSVQGYVKVMFSVDVDGTLKDISIVESMGDLFDNEAIRVIKRSPPWKPASFNGYPVSSRMSIKLTFKVE
ncbi:MAG: TonB family protein [Imperialibacter sp.]|uniref:energy transducer TonB n=1 Tax=Imperialibacter sp. TaxID=2038411 RepID=UPI0032EC88FD